MTSAPERLKPILAASDLYMSSRRVGSDNVVRDGFHATIMPCTKMQHGSDLYQDVLALDQQLRGMGFQVRISDHGAGHLRLDIRGLPLGMDMEAAAKCIREITGQKEAPLHPLVKEEMPIKLPNEADGRTDVPTVPRIGDCKVAGSFLPTHLASADRGSRSV